MLNEAQRKAPLSPTERKKELITQGAAFRAGIIRSRHGVHTSLRPDALASGAIDHIMTTVSAAFKNENATGGMGVNLQAILPLLLGGVSALSKMSSLKPILRGTLILGVAVAVAAFIVKNKKTTQTSR